MVGTRVLATLLVFLIGCTGEVAEGSRHVNDESERNGLFTKTFRSPAFTLGPGDVVDKIYHVEMPSGHVALRSFNAEVVDSAGTPIPLSETYLHHWVLMRTFIATGSIDGRFVSRTTLVPNDGVCRPNLTQWFGLGSETRRTNTTIPPPYGIVIGDTLKIPEGLEEAWFLNVHAIDTRGAVDARGCTECLCDLYNLSYGDNGRVLDENYEGGLHCCYDETHCIVKDGFEGVRRDLFMEYTVKWVSMDESVQPLRVYILDVTNSRAAVDQTSQCKIEYTVQACAQEAKECIHTAEAAAFLPDGGQLIYAVGHQHSAGVGIALHNENGDEMCSSYPVYGEGSGAGNESGYIVGMSTCYPKIGSVHIRAGEELRLTSWYNNEQRHTGVMGLFYLLVADSLPPPKERHLYSNVVLVTLIIVASITFIGVTIARYLKMIRERSGYEAL